ncbi:TPA: hypothetical protein HA238_03015 [Candidatus Micrarchaeota archaeon]|nr:hypothetical protein [Candidatus Micrarchaeota archaeon]
MKFRNILFSSVILIILLIAGCTQSEKKEGGNTKITETVKNIPTTTSETLAPPPKTLRGFSLSPKSFESADFKEFLEKVKAGGSALAWSGDWKQLESNDNGAKVISELCPQYGCEPIGIVQFFTQTDGELLRPLSAETKQKYKESAVEFAKKYKPEYFGIGIELNILYEKSPADFDEFVTFYAEVYDAIKTASPGTKVFTIFQLEKMKGLGGGLFGGENNPANAQWDILNKFKKSDIIAFTTYPGLIYPNPSEIPADYYSEIKSHTTKPIAFTEIGWHSAASPKGWESSESEQAEFVKIFFNRTTGLNSEFIVWSFLYDQKTIEPFNSMGLYGTDGNAKTAWAEWLSAK